MQIQPTDEFILKTIRELLSVDADWDFNLLCQDALQGKKERRRQFEKNKRRYEEEKKARLAAKMAQSRCVVDFV